MGNSHDMDQQPKKKKVSNLAAQLVIIAILLGLAVFSYFFGDKGIFFYVVICMSLNMALVYFLSLFDRYKIIRVIRDIVSLPIGALFLFVDFGQVIFARLMSFMVVLAILGVIIMKVIPATISYTFSYQAQLYLIITTAVIITYQFSDYFVGWYHKIMSPDKMDKLIQLSNKYSDQSKIRVFIFVLYFILLIFITVTSLNGTNLFSAEKLDIAILQSFATYVAYDRIVSNWSSIKNPNKKSTNEVS